VFDPDEIGTFLEKRTISLTQDYKQMTPSNFHAKGLCENNIPKFDGAEAR